MKEIALWKQFLEETEVSISKLVVEYGLSGLLAAFEEYLYDRELINEIKE